MVLGSFQYPGVLLIWITVGQGPSVLSVGASGGGLYFFSLVYHFSCLSPSLLEVARYRLKYCLKGLLNPKQPNKAHGMHAVKICMMQNGNFSYLLSTWISYHNTSYHIERSMLHMAVSKMTCHWT